MGQMLKLAPVYFVAAQVRHNPIGAWEDEAKRNLLKERLRKLGYSDQQEMKSNVVVQVEGQSVQLQAPRQLMCMNAVRDSAVAVQTDRFWLQTTNYQDFPRFKAAFFAALGEVHAEVGLDYVDAISMRMLDAIVPSDGESLMQYLPEALLGLDSWAQDRHWSLEHQSSEHVFLTEKNRILLRCVRRPGRVGFPPDFSPIGMEILERHRQANVVHAILDSDAVHEGRQAVDLEVLGQYLDSIKGDLSQCFKNIVTPHALERWA